MSLVWIKSARLLLNHIVVRWSLSVWRCIRIRDNSGIVMISNLDYNLLQTYVLLYKHRNLKAVGRALGVTESAVSKHLSKLRDQLDDQLFVRDTQGLEPTAFTEQVIPILTDGLNTIQSALAKDSIDCENYTDDIVISILPIMHLQFGTELLLELKEKFPKATISLLTYDDNTTQDIINGSIDLGVNYFNPTLSQSTYQGHIKRIKHAAILPSSLADLDDEQILELPFIGVKARGRNDIKILVEEVSARMDHKLNVYANVDNLYSLLNTIDKVKGFSIIQAYNLKDERFCLRVLPEKLQKVDNFSLVGVMKASNKSNPLHLLLLDLIKKKIEPFVIS